MTTRSATSDENQSVQDEGDLRKYFHVIPNMVDDDMDPYQYRLYGHYKRVCGANGGTCRERTSVTAQKCRMSPSKVKSTRKWLADHGWVMLDWVGETGNELVHITILDIWLENMNRYAPESRRIPPSPKNYPRLPKNQGGGHQKTTPGYQEATEERTIEEKPKKKKTTYERGGNGTATEGFSDIQQPPLLEPEVVVVETHISPPVAPKPTPSPRPRDLMYDAIEETWGTYAGGRIGKLKRQLLGNIPKSERGHEANFETPATPDEVRGFGAWWKRTYPKLPLPMDAVKVQDHFYKFRATAVMPVVAEAGMVERNGHWLRKW